jgi:signal transduction histidine kinase
MFRSRSLKFYLSLLAGVFVMAISLYGYILLRTHSGLPKEIAASELVRIDDIEIKSVKDVEFVLTQRSIGDWATFWIKQGGEVSPIRAQFVSFYGNVPFPLVYLLIGLFSFFIGVVVFIFKWRQKEGRILYWLALVFASVLIINGGTYCLRRAWLTYLPAALFYILYPLAPALLFRFSLAFARREHRLGIAIVYGLALVISATLVSVVLLAAFKSSIEIFRLYVSIYRYFRIYMIALLLLAIFHFIYIYRRASLEEHRAQIKWVFLGLIFGLGPFIFIYQIPAILKVQPLLSEEYSTVFFVFVPLGFALSIFRFRFLDVELVIKRSLVYSLLTIFIASVYIFSVRVFQDLFSRKFMISEASISLGSAVLAAIAFHPARKKIQEFVDRAFFQQSYDYRKAILRFNEAAPKFLSQEELVDFFVAHVKSIVPVDRLSVNICAVGPAGIDPVFAEGTSSKQALPFSFGQSSEMILARQGATTTEERIDFSQTDVLQKHGFEIAFCLPFKSDALTGLVALGKKKSEARFSRDDIELLETLAGELALNIERFRLKEEIVYEKASREKLDELNRLKTEFISTVSHELRTPLSSIQGLAEVLQEGKVKNAAKRGDLLAVLASESSRLSRLLHNILDFGKIEQQTKTFDFQPTEIKPLIEEAVEVFRLQLDEAGFKVRLDLPAEPVALNIDRDAIKQVLINLIDNAIKYSSEKKEIDIRLVNSRLGMEIQVQDRGIGMSAEEADQIFEKFYRAPAAARCNAKGVGLGLKIAKHIMAAHRGDIRVESRPGRGSTFKLAFPKT